MKIDYSKLFKYISNTLNEKHMSILTIILFFVYTYGLGYSISFFLKSSDNFFERNLIRIGFGLAAIPLLGVILNLLHVPLDWRIIFALSLAMPAYRLFKLRKDIKMPVLKLTKSDIAIILILLMFSLTLFMYVKGSFVYPYLEDDDPWTHVVSIKYAALEKNVNDKTDALRYIDPYPPGFAILFGVLHQTSPEIIWTMKVFNALIISLGIIFFYFFAKEFIGSRNKALFSTAALVMIPSYLTHFIWAHSYILTVFFPLMYALEKIKDDAKWKYISMAMFAGILLIQPTKAIKLAVMIVIYLIVISILRKKVQWNAAAAFIGGFLLSLLWWYNKMISLSKLHGPKPSAFSIEETNFLANIIAKLAKALPNTSGTGTRAYAFSDYFFAKSQNLINSPVGVGAVLFILFFIALIVVLARYKSILDEKNHWIAVTLGWLLFIFIGMNSVTFNLPIGLTTFRFWLLFAIPVSLLASEGAWFLAYFLKRFKIPVIATLLLLLTGIFFTSAVQKYAVNTALWMPGQMWTSNDELQGFLWLKTLPANTRIFSYSNGEAVLGFGQSMCMWCQDTIDFKNTFINTTVTEKYDWLKKNNYRYFIVSGADFRDLAYYYGENKANIALNGVLADSSDYFRPAYQTKGAVIFSVL